MTIIQARNKMVAFARVVGVEIMRSSESLCIYLKTEPTEFADEG